MDWPLPDVGMAFEDWQAGRCGVCGNIPHNRLVRDHDHHTGLERGLLCRRCNTQEASGTGPLWWTWRAGWNPATLLGADAEYVGWGSALEAYGRTVDCSMDELRSAVNLLPSLGANPPVRA